MLNSVSVVFFETLFICTLNANKIIFVTFNLNCGLHSVSVCAKLATKKCDPVGIDERMM